MTTDQTTELLALVRDFLDPDPCSFDHHGYCQAHGHLGGEPMSCPHGRARKLLADLAAVSPVGQAPATGQAFTAAVRASLARYRQFFYWAPSAVDMLRDDLAAHLVADLSPLPQSATVRAAVLREAADRLAVLRAEVDDGDDDAVGVRWGLSRAEDELRQWAVEEPLAEPATVDRAAVLSDVERRVLAYALDLAEEEMLARGDDEDELEAVTNLRRLGAEPVVVPDRTDDETPHRCRNCEGIDPDTCLMNPDRPAVGGAQQPTEDRPPVAYSDGRGRVFCLGCPRPDGTPVPLTADGVDHWELCPSCGRHVVDVARDTEQQGHGAP
jgi:hypothetical protein